MFKKAFSKMFLSAYIVAMVWRLFSTRMCIRQHIFIFFYTEKLEKLYITVLNHLVSKLNS